MVTSVVLHTPTCVQRIQFSGVLALRPTILLRFYQVEKPVRYVSSY